MHDNLKTLNLSGNKLSGLTIADALSSCPKLRSLFLSRNPIEKAPRYRLLISSLIPGISMLDGLPVDPDAQSKISNGMILEAAHAMNLQDEENDDEQRLEMMMFEKEPTNDSNDSKPSHHHIDNNTNINNRQSTMLDTGSELTHGSNVALAGNMAAAMRKRRSKYPSTDDVSTLDILDSALSSSSSMSSLNNSSYKNSKDSIERRKMKIKEDKSDLATIPFFSEGDLTKQLNKNNNDKYIINGDDSPPKVTKEALSPNIRNRSNNDINIHNNTTSTSSNRTGVTQSDSFNNSTRNYTKFNNGDKLERPKSAAPSYLRSTTAPTQLEDGRIRDTVVNSLEFYPESESPRQMNGSRPQSAVPSSRSRHQVPFKIAVDGSDINKLKSRLNIASKRDTADTSPPRESYINNINNMKLFDDDNAKIKNSGSIIHRDIIIRNEDDLDGEDIGVTHASRHKLMASSSSRNRVVRNGLGLDSPEITPRSASIDISNISSVECTPVIENTPKTPASLADRILPSDFHRPNSATISSMAGVSLGFDLLGSLAAIDQWVEDMESDSDNEEEDIQQMRMRMKSTPVKEKRILSRDTIYQMCNDNDNGNDVQDISNNDNNIISSNSIHEDNNNKIFVKQDAGKNAKTRGKPKPLPDASAANNKSAGIFIVEDTSPPRQDNNTNEYNEYVNKLELGDWSLLSDIEIIDMLKQPPKLVASLKTKSSFQNFFKGIKENKMRMLLEEAFSTSTDINERKDKVNRRMDLLGDVLIR